MIRKPLGLKIDQGNEVSKDPANILTQSELLICRLIILGYTAKEIARFASVAPRTVEAHIQNSRRKLRARNSVHLAAILLVSGAIKVTIEELTKTYLDDLA